MSQDLKHAMTKQKTTFQLVPPHTHRANAAERAIQTFKAYFTAGLASVDPEFPVSEWDRLLQQVFITLNLLRTARVNPRLSSHAYLYGNFDFNSTPLAPPGTKTIVHIKPETRPSWGSRGKEAWYVGPSLNHYRCVRCYIPTTRSEVDSDTVTFFPKSVKFPEVSITDFLRQAAIDIVALLKNPPSSTVPSLMAGDNINNAIYILASLLNNTHNINDTVALARSQTFNQPPISNHPLRPVKIPSSSFQVLPPKKSSHCPNHTSQNSLSNKTITPLPRVPSVPSLSPMRSLPRVITPANATNHLANHIFDPSGKKQTLDSLLQGPTKAIWQRSASNEFGRLAQGNNHGVKGTNTIQFISKQDLPPDQKITYATFVCDYKPFKAETHRVRMVVGGNRLDYHEDAGAPAASLLETKILLNSIISDAHRGARFMTCDLKDFFLATPMQKPEYMKIPITSIPQDIIDQYKLNSLRTSTNQIYIKIVKGMYVRPQASCRVGLQKPSIQPRKIQLRTHSAHCWSLETQDSQYPLLSLC